MRKWIFVFLALCLGLSPALARAQSDLSLTTLEVDLWPEYDAPEMLVIYNFELPADAVLPLDVTFRVPIAAGQLFGYGYYPEDGSVPVQENYAQGTDGGWLVVSFTMRSLRGTLEYYDPALSKSGSQRQFEFIWPGDYAVQALRIVAQQPVGAENVQLSNPASSTFTGKNGLTHHVVTVGALAAGSTYSLKLDYQKSSSRLSVENMPVEPASPLPENMPNSWFPWVAGILVAVGVLLLAGALTWYVLSLRRGRSTEKPRNRRRASQETKAAVTGDGVYCHQCGRRATPGDRFCRSCGVPLRVE